MDPDVWTTLAEFWWIGPAVIGAGAVGWFGVRHERRERARRIAYDAAKLDVRAAKEQLSAARTDVKVARADLLRAQAERAASRTSAAEVADARQRLTRAQRELKAASASVRAGRARVTAARAALPTAATAPEDLPLARLIAQHDAVTARWMSYETDAAKALAFPAMSDGRQPPTAAYLTLQAEAMRLRPRGERVTAAEFAAYRRAVAQLEPAFEAAEANAWRLARADGTAPRDQPGPSQASPPAVDWTTLAQNVISRSAESLSRATEAAAAAFEARRDEWAAGGRRQPGNRPNEGRPDGPATRGGRQDAHWRDETTGRGNRPGERRPDGTVARGSDDASPHPATPAAAPPTGDDDAPPWPVPRRG